MPAFVGFEDACLAANAVVYRIARYSPKAQLRPKQAGGLRNVRGADRDAVVFSGSAAHRRVEDYEHVCELDREPEPGRLPSIRFKVVQRLYKARVSDDARISNCDRRNADSRLWRAFVFFRPQARRQKLSQRALGDRLRVAQQTRR